jgi:hypothetical protein
MTMTRASTKGFFINLSVCAIAILAVAAVGRAEDGDLLYGPGGVERIRALALDTRLRPYGPVPADVVTNILDRAAKFRQTTYSYRKGDFAYTFSPVQPDPHQDEYPYWTAMFQERSDSITTRINSLTFSFLVNRQIEDFQAALDMVLALAAWDDWSDPDVACYPGPACLDTGHMVMAVAYFYDAARGSLIEADRQVIVTALTEKGLAPLAAACAHALGQPAHNYHAIMASGLALGAVALLHEDQRATGWLDRAVAVAEHWLDGQGADGGAIEYHGYGAYALDYLVRLIQVASHQGRSVKKSPFLDNVSAFFLNALIPDSSGVGTFGDSWPECGAATHLYLAYLGDRLAQTYLVDTDMIFQHNEPDWTTDFMTVQWAEATWSP